MKYSYYVGLQLPPETSELIAKIQKQLFDPIESIEPLEPHVTLLPPPAVEELKPEDFAIHLKAAAKDFLPLTYELDDVITYDGHAVALSVLSLHLADLQRKLVDLLPFGTAVTYTPNTNFMPHVTLVQALHGRELPSQLVAQYEQAFAPILPITCNVTHLTLFEWTGPRKYRARAI